MSKLSSMDKESKKNYLFSSVVWKREIGDIEIDEEKVEIINDIILTWDSLYVTNVITLARLIKYADVIDIKKNFHILSSMPGNERKKRNLNMFILQFGMSEGTEKYNHFLGELNINKRYTDKFGEIDGKEQIIEYKKKLSISQTKKVEREGPIPQKERSLMCKEYWTKKGYSIDDAIYLAKNHNTSMNKNSQKVKHNHPRINIPNTLDYWLYRGFDYETAIQKQKEITVKSIQSKDMFEKKYGEKWVEKWEEMCYKRQITQMKTHTKNDGFVCKASKQSLEYFNPLRTWLIEKYKISPDDIYVGIEGSKEFFLAHSTLYYFRYDFTIRPKKIIIEYHGDRWHPADILTEEQRNSWVSPYGISYKTQNDIDTKRKDIAEKLGFKYYVIWSYKDREQEMKNVMNFIEESI